MAVIMGWHNSNFDGLSEHQLGQAVGNSWPLGVAQKLFDDSQLHLKLSRRAENPFCLNANALPFRRGTGAHLALEEVTSCG